MGKFKDLLRSKGPTLSAKLRVQEEARELFPSTVAGSKLHFWKPENSIWSKGIRILLGVAATYSESELELLDRIDERLASNDSPQLHVDVFDLGSCPTKSELEKYFPETRKINCTPAVGIWKDGELVEMGVGPAAIKLIESRILNV